MALPLICNSKIYYMAIGATFLMSCPNSIIIYELLTKLIAQTRFTGTGVGSGPGVFMALLFRYHAEIYIIAIIVTLLISKPNCSAKDEVLTWLRCTQDVQRGTKVLVPGQSFPWPYQLYVMLKSIL